MRRLIVLIAALAALPALPALADPSSSAGASRSVETGGSEKINREKSVSQDKSTGNKSSSSRSRETSRERSRESKEGLSAKQEQSRKRDFSVKLNANPLLVSEFIAEFEAGPPPEEPVSNMRSAREFFAACRPFGNLDADFPVLAYGILSRYPAADGGLDILHERRVVGHVVPSNVFGPSEIPITTKSRAGPAWGQETVYKGVLLPPAPENLFGGAIAYYAACRISAHYFISRAAGMTLTALEERGIRIRDEGDMRRAIRVVYRHLADPAQPGTREFWGEVVGQSLELWRKARCSSFLGYAGTVGSGHNLDCGIFRITGEAIYVNGVPTLSADAIDGRRIEIALADADSDSRTASRETNRNAKESASSKTSESSEAYADSKRTANMKASKSSDTSTSRKTGRDAKADVGAKPGQ